MNNNNEAFTGLIGQEPVKTRLKHYLECYEKTRFVPSLLFEASGGIGKSTFAMEFAKNLKKNLIEVNGATIKSPKALVEGILMEMQGKEVTLFIDEIHGCNPKVFTLLLSLLNPNESKKNMVSYDNMEFEVDFTKVTFLSATTDVQKLPLPLRDRLTAITFKDYTHSEVGKIIKKQLKGIDFEDDALELLGSLSRGNARQAVLMGQEVKNYINLHDIKKVDMKVTKTIQGILGVLPLGLNQGEYNTLKHLYEAKEGLTLTHLCAKTGSEMAPQKTYESYLLKNSLMEIDGKRHITPAGIKYVDFIEFSV